MGVGLREHPTLLQASLLRFLFPSGVSFAELAGKSAEAHHTVGAPDVLCYLRVHVKK